MTILYQTDTERLIFVATSQVGSYLYGQVKLPGGDWITLLAGEYRYARLMESYIINSELDRLGL